MLISLHDIHQYKMKARDGEIGHVSDFIFDQKDWKLRFVADKTSRVFGREVLVPASAISRTDWREQTLHVNLDREQVRQGEKVKIRELLSPGGRQYLNINELMMIQPGSQHLPMSSSPSTDHGSLGVLMNNMLPENQRERVIVQDLENDESLQSTQMVLGFRITTRNGELGRVEDFIVDESDWSIQYMVIRTSGADVDKRILVSPESIDWVSWRKKHVSVDMDSEKLQGCPNLKLTFPLSQTYRELLDSQYECGSFWT